MYRIWFSVGSGIPTQALKYFTCSVTSSAQAGTLKSRSHAYFYFFEARSHGCCQGSDPWISAGTAGEHKHTRTFVISGKISRRALRKLGKHSTLSLENTYLNLSILPSDVSLNLSLLFFFLHFHGLKILPKPENLLFLLVGGVVSPASTLSMTMPGSPEGCSASSVHGGEWEKTANLLFLYNL